MRVSQTFGALEQAVDRLVHPSARGDELTRQRHRAFIASHLAGGLLALASLPIYLALWGAPGAREAAALGWLATPVLIALFLVRTGRFEAAHVASAVMFTGLVGYVGWWTGGLSSLVVAWLVLVPLEAALSGSRRVVGAAIAASAAAAVSLHIAGVNNLLPPADPLALGSAVLLVGAVTALVYAGGLAMNLEAAHRRTEQIASADERRYRLLADNVTDLITRHTRSGLVLFASPSSVGLCGAAPADLAGDGLFMRVHVADRPAFLHAFDEAVRRGAAVATEFRVNRAAPAGIEWRWVEMHCRPVAGQDEHGIELVAVTRDIEARKVQEVALTAANAKAEQASAAKSRFLANMSHELRTPLNAIIGFSEMMTHESFKALGEDRVAEYAALINDSGRHLLDVVNGILDMSKIEAGCFDITPEPFDARDLVANVIAIMQPVAEKAGVNLVAELPADAPELVADRRACKQIYLNLLSNAVKFTPRGGRVLVAVRFEAGRAYLSVADNGIGISESDLPRLAQPFMQAQSTYNRAFEGTGLGLSVVKGLVDLHGGELTIRSRIGDGTVVTVMLPLVAEAEPEAGGVVTRFPAPDPRAETQEPERMLRRA